MYSQQELDDAVASGVITADAADALRAHIERQRSTAIPDEEQFRLLTGFNDIFVSIAAAILLFAVGWIGQSIGQATGSASSPTTATGPELPRAARRRRRRPGASPSSSPRGAEWRCPRSCSFSPSSAVSWRLRHSCWHRSSGPIASTTTARRSPAVDRRRQRRDRRRRRLASLAPLPRADHRRRGRCCRRRPVRRSSSSRSLHPTDGESAKNLILGFVLLLGIGMFLFAMWWDASDRARLTRRSDVAFWLHLLAAPMIAHPIFTLLGLNNGSVSIGEALIVVGPLRPARR